MKYLYTFILIAVMTNLSISQNIHSYNQRVDSIMLLNTKDHYNQDTLWVKDSIIQYSVVNGVGLMLEGTYKTISRNDQGNTISYLFLVNENNPQTTENSIYDSTVYFNKESVRKHYQYIWSRNEDTWLLGNYNEYETPSLIKENISKWFSNNSQSFVFGYRYLYNNQNGLVDTLIIQDYISETDSWKYRNRTKYFYNESDNDTMKMIYNWKNSEWSDSAKVQQIYESNHLIHSIEFVLNDDESAWIYYRKKITSYTVFGEEDLIHQLRWDINTNSWVDEYKTIITYDDEEREINNLFLEYSFTSQQLENYHNTISNYEMKSKEVTHQLWDPAQEIWQNYSQYYYSYIYEDLIDTSQNNTWNDETQQWQGSYMFVSVFDKHYNKTNMTRYNFLVNDWEMARKFDYYWSPFIPNDILEMKRSPITTYPNPASSSVTFLAKNLPQNSNHLVSIFNLSGQIVARVQKTDGELKWDCSNYESGLYFYSIKIEEERFTGKIIVN